MRVMNWLVAQARLLQSDFSRGTPVVFFLRLRSGTIFVGATLDLETALEAHAIGLACDTTRRNPPVRFLRLESYPHFRQARERQAQVRRWTNAKKTVLLNTGIRPPDAANVTQ
jgi:putative endonuclease